MRGFGLRQKIALSLVVIVAVALGANIVWNVNAQQQRMTTELVEKASILNEEMMSVWDFISDNQDRINYDSAGNYEFKRLQCSLVGMSIGNIFNRRTDYIVKYTSPQPRNPLNKADEHETEAFEAFKQDPTLTNYYGFSQYKGQDSFRYIAPMLVEKSCLDCHGGNPGEVDELGYEMEAMQEGDVYGTVSITMPVKALRDNMTVYVIQEIFFAGFVLISVVGLIYFLLTKWVTRPLVKLQVAAGQIAQGNWDLEITEFGSKGEIQDLVSDFSQMAEQLKSAYNTLENQVENRTEALSNANLLLEQQSITLQNINQRLIEENTYKTDFLSIISHELRTPLTSIMAFVDQLQKSDEQRSLRTDHLLRELNISSQTLLGKINNVLETARLDAGRADVTIETVDIGDVLAVIENMMRPVAENKGVELAIQIDSTVPLLECDRDKLHSIISNLVGNALKFTDEGDSITAHVSYPLEKDFIRIDIEDTGIGISREDQGVIFGRFARGDSPTPQNYGGTGLGLALVKEYTEMLGGEISLSSSLGQGSVFSVFLPRLADN